MGLERLKSVGPRRKGVGVGGVEVVMAAQSDIGNCSCASPTRNKARWPSGLRRHVKVYP